MYTELRQCYLWRLCWVVAFPCSPSSLSHRRDAYLLKLKGISINLTRSTCLLLVWGFTCGFTSFAFKYLRKTWLCGACCEPPGWVWKVGSGGWRLQLGAGDRPASGSGAGFVQRTASGSESGPDWTHTDRSAPGSHLLDANLATQKHPHFRQEMWKATWITQDNVVGDFRVNPQSFFK